MEVRTVAILIPRRLKLISLKALQYNLRNQCHSFAKRGFEKNAFKVLKSFEKMNYGKNPAPLKWLYLLKYFEFWKILLGVYSEMSSL